MSYATSKCMGILGRLGNQMFQIAATVGYALDNKKDYTFIPYQWQWQEYMELPLLEVECNNEVCEDSLRFTHLPFKEGNVNVHGHLLSTQYFNHHRKHLLNLMKLTPKWDEYVSNLYDYTDTCSVHVRRGDFMEAGQVNNQGYMKLDYYKCAVDKLKGKDTTMIICSDDIQWCKDNFTYDKQIFVEGNPDIIDMFITSKCSNNVISNSSFGWWGAYLNQTKGHRVVAPRQWFVETDGWDDLYDDNWIVI